MDEGNECRVIGTMNVDRAAKDKTAETALLGNACANHDTDRRARPIAEEATHPPKSVTDIVRRNTEH